MENQCVGLAEAIGSRCEVKHVRRPSAPLWNLPPRLWPNPLANTAIGVRLAPPWPNLLISSGRGSVAAALAIRKASKGTTFAIHIQTPYWVWLSAWFRGKFCKRGSGLGLIAFLILSVAGGLLLSHSFLKRVDTIRTTAQAIVSGNLGSRIPLGGTNDNFDLLAAILNDMLDRIEALMESMIQVSNDIAHALRTPLTRLQQKVEAAQSEVKDNPSYETAIDAVRLEAKNILETFSALLRIAQIEGGSRQSGFGEIDLTELFVRVTDAFSDLAEDQGKTLVAEIEPSVRTWGDRELLAEMVANLVDNAIRHTPIGARVEISLVRDHSHIVASVSDNGFGVPKEDRDRIFQRFFRLERSAKIQGTGLGLSLVAAVAGLHRIQVSVEDRAPGLSIKMRFDAVIQPIRKLTLAQRPREFISPRGFNDSLH